MKKVISVVVLLGILFWIYQIIFNNILKDNILAYSVKNHDGMLANVVQERLTVDDKFKGKYKIEIYFDALLYKISVDSNNMNDVKKNKLVKDFYYYDNKNIKCLYPIIKDISNDVLCYVDGKQVNYVDIEHKSERVKSFVSDLVSKGFKYSEW